MEDVVELGGLGGLVARERKRERVVVKVGRVGRVEEVSARKWVRRGGGGGGGRGIVVWDGGVELDKVSSRLDRELDRDGWDGWC